MLHLKNWIFRMQSWKTWAGLAMGTRLKCTHSKMGVSIANKSFNLTISRYNLSSEKLWYCLSLTHTNRIGNITLLQYACYVCMYVHQPQLHCHNTRIHITKVSETLHTKVALMNMNFSNTQGWYYSCSIFMTHTPKWSTFVQNPRRIVSSKSPCYSALSDHTRYLILMYIMLIG